MHHFQSQSLSEEQCGTGFNTVTSSSCTKWGRQVKCNNGYTIAFWHVSTMLLSFCWRHPGPTRCSVMHRWNKMLVFRHHAVKNITTKVSEDLKFKWNIYSFPELSFLATTGILHEKINFKAWAVNVKHNNILRQCVFSLNSFWCVYWVLTDNCKFSEVNV